MPIAGDFEKLWNAYPKGFSRSHAPGTDEADEDERIFKLGETLKKTVGGGVDNPAFINLCVIRLTYAMNRAGLKIPQITPLKWYGGKAYKVAKGGDGYWYGLGVTETLHFLQEKYGKADLELAGPFDGPSGSTVVPPDLKGKRGILIFLVSGWSDASGHATLWNGSLCSDNDYFETANKIHFWEIVNVAPKPVRIENLNDAIRLRAILVSPDTEG